MDSMNSLQKDDPRRLLKDYQARIPDRVNLVELLGANENAHTRILVAILAYKREGQLPFAKSFVARFLRNGDKQAPVQVQHPHIETQRQNIDALIWEPSKYAIVIENKINWASDQKQQIERYVKATNDLCCIQPDNQCYVIYLTDDGRKEVSDISLTPEAKNFLGYNDNSSGRYIELNYKDDILPWLKEDVLSSCRYIEQTLVSMLQQYIDYLERRFGIGEHDEEIRFLEAHLHGTEKEKYAQLTRWNEFCKDFSGEEGLPKETTESFSSQLRNAMEQLVKRNYSLDSQSAFESKVSTIKNWAWENGFYPHKWYNCIFFEFRDGSYNERIKFQIVLAEDEARVVFFNNDFKADRPSRVLSDFPRLHNLFQTIFPQHGEQLVQYEDAVLGTITSEAELLVKLNGPVKEFLNAFYAEFQSIHANDS